MRTADEIRTSIAEKSNRMVALSRELDRSLALQAFEPRAFEGGPCRVVGSSNKHKPWDGTITLHLASGDSIGHTAKFVPFDLWPPEMQAELRAIAADKRPKELRDR